MHLQRIFALIYDFHELAKWIPKRTARFSNAFRRLISFVKASHSDDASRFPDIQK
jgi:hypothetical protein